MLVYSLTFVLFEVSSSRCNTIHPCWGGGGICPSVAHWWTPALPVCSEDISHIFSRHVIFHGVTFNFNIHTYICLNLWTGHQTTTATACGFFHLPRAKLQRVQGIMGNLLNLIEDLKTFLKSSNSIKCISSLFPSTWQHAWWLQSEALHRTANGTGTSSVRSLFSSPRLSDWKANYSITLCTHTG